MAKVTKKTKIGKKEKPFLIVDGSKKFEVELTTKDVSFISNALKNFHDSKLSFMTTPRKNYAKKLFMFFDGLLEE